MNRTILQALIAAAFVPLLQADYTLSLCGPGFGPCQILPSLTQPTEQQLSVLETHLISPLLWITTQDSNPEGDIIGSLCTFELCGPFMFVSGDLTVWEVGEMALTDLNSSGLVVGANSLQVPWDSEGLLTVPILPDKRLKLPHGDLLSATYGELTAVDDLGQFHGVGSFTDLYGNTVSGEYDLLLPTTPKSGHNRFASLSPAPVPEPATIWFLGMALLAFLGPTAHSIRRRP